MPSYTHAKVTVLFTCVRLAFCEAATTNSLVIGQGKESGVGDKFSPRFSVPSKAEALARLESLKALGRRVTAQEFLGGDVQIVQIVFYGSPINSLERAEAVLRDLLSSHVLAPELRGGPELFGPMWSESTSATIRATVRFRDGRVGRIESDVTDDKVSGAVHLFLEDHAGTFWWHRWDAAFPRRSEKVPASK